VAKGSNKHMNILDTIGYLRAYVVRNPDTPRTHIYLR
jgi:hypothetical protein